MPLELPTVAIDALLHRERRVAGPHGVVLVGQGRAEQRHDPVAQDLVDDTVVPVDRFHHQLEHRVQNLAGFFRVAVGDDLQRAPHVREEHRDVLALPLEGRFRGEDPLREVLG